MFTSIEQFLIPLRDLRQMTGAYHLRGGRWLGSRFERGVTNSIARFIAAVDRAPFYREQSRFVEGYLLDEWLGNFGTSNHIYSSVISYFRRIGDKSGIDKVEYLIDRSNLFDNRKDLSGFLSSFFYSLYWGLLKFGRSTFRAVIISIAIIFAFSFGYWDSDIYTYSTLKAGVDGDMEITDRKLNFVEAVYFSSVTFATLGYGDISPNKDLIREGCLERWNFDGHPFESLCSTKLLMPVLEAGLGAMMIALIVVTIVKQASRHYG
ncbi:MAG: potassium channel family protein [Pseudomonadota bacterium]